MSCWESPIRFFSCSLVADSLPFRRHRHLGTEGVPPDLSEKQCNFWESFREPNLVTGYPDDNIKQSELQQSTKEQVEENHSRDRMQRMVAIEDGSRRLKWQKWSLLFYSNEGAPMVNVEDWRGGTSTNVRTGDMDVYKLEIQISRNNC